MYKENKVQFSLIPMMIGMFLCFVSSTGLQAEGWLKISKMLEKKPYSNKQHGFKINPPKGWRIEENEFGSIVFFTNIKHDGKEPHLFFANIGIASEPVQGSNLDNIVSASKTGLPRFFNNYKLLDDREVEVNGISAHILGGTFAQGSYPLRNLQIIIPKEGKTYIITGTALESTWNQYMNLIETSLMTFSFLK